VCVVLLVLSSHIGKWHAPLGNLNEPHVFIHLFVSERAQLNAAAAAASRKQPQRAFVQHGQLFHPTGARHYEKVICSL